MNRTTELAPSAATPSRSTLHYPGWTLAYVTTLVALLLLSPIFRIVLSGGQIEAPRLIATR